MHSVASQEKQEYAIQNKPTIVDIPSKAAPFIAKEISDKRMTEKFDTFFSDLKENTPFLKMAANKL